MWGSDWPVLNLAGDYGRWQAACDEWLADLPAAAQAGVWGTNAARFYGIK